MSSRKPLSQHTAHHTKAELEQIKQEEDAATSPKKCFSGTPPKGLIDARAKAEWKRIAPIILEDMALIGDLDIANLIGYCNSFSMYQRVSEQLAKEPLIVEEGKKNPLIGIQTNYAKETRDFAMKAGLSVDYRLKYAALKVKEQDEEINDEFGDI